MPSVRSALAAARFRRAVTAHAAARAARSIECDAVAYLSSFENHPAAVSRLAAGRALWGNSPDGAAARPRSAARREALRRRGCATPDVYVAPARTSRPVGRDVSAVSDSGGRWLVKPLASGGGHRVRPWRRGTRVPRGCYLQELVDGTPGSVVFVAAGGRAVPLGVSRQLVGERAFGASGYRYCGNILAAAGDATSRDGAGGRGVRARPRRGRGVRPRRRQRHRLRRARRRPVRDRSQPALVRVDGARRARLRPLGVRRARGGVRRRRAAGVRSRARRDAAPARWQGGGLRAADVVVGDTRAWLAGRSRASATCRTRASAFAPAGRSAPSSPPAATHACYAALVRRADRVYAELAGWEGR